MIEYSLLFGLGFLTAILLVSLMAPAIHRRIVVYTEKRLRATMPISPQEVRAQKDMARALYAAENARTRQELDAEREKALSLKFRNDGALDEAGKLLNETRELTSELEQMRLEASDLRAKARRHEDAAARLKSALSDAEETAISRTQEISGLTKRISAISREFDDLKIALSARDLEVEQARLKAASWRKERETLTQELDEASARNRELSNAVNRESRKVARLEEQLGQETARHADKELQLERRTQEAVRLKALLEGAERPVAEATVVAAPAPATLAAFETGAAATERLAREIEEIRNQGTALTERLLNSRGSGNDEAMRREISQIAARMIALTIAQEGSASPIPSMIAAASSETGRKNLASRASDLIAQQTN